VRFRYELLIDPSSGSFPSPGTSHEVYTSSGSIDGPGGEELTFKARVPSLGCLLSSVLLSEQEQYFCADFELLFGKVGLSPSG
jgi:hypothetical protein